MIDIEDLYAESSRLLQGRLIL